MRTRTIAIDVRDARLIALIGMIVATLALLAPVARAKPGGGSAGSMTVNAGAAATSTTAVTLDSSVAGAVQMQFRNAGGAWSGWKPYSATYAWTLPTGDGVKTVDAQYKSSTGKPLSRSDTIVLDTQAPSIATLTSSTHPDEALWYPLADLSAQWTAQSDVSGVTDYSWVVDQTAGTLPDAVGEGGATSTTFSAPGDGVWYVHVRAIDTAGNAGAAVHRALRVDTAAPVTAAGPVPTGPVRSFTFGFAASDALSGVALIEYRIDGGAWKSGSSVALRRVIRHRTAGQESGEHVIEYRATDLAGNVEPAAGFTFTIQ